MKGSRGYRAGKLERKALTIKKPPLAPPPSVAEDFLAIWRSITSDFPPEHFRASDTETLTQYCETVIRLRRVRAELQTAPLSVTDASGKMKPHPLLATEVTLSRALLAYARALRLNPNARTMTNQVPDAPEPEKVETSEMVLQLVQ